MNFIRKFSFLVGLCFLTGALFGQTNTTTVVLLYVNTPDSAVNQSSMAALSWTMGSLNNSGGSEAGFRYTTTSVQTFQDAAAYIRVLPVS